MSLYLNYHYYRSGIGGQVINLIILNKMKNILIKTITLYQKTISPIFLNNLKITCSFYPSCSEYTKQVIFKYGPLKGLFLFFKRFIRCHPWQKNHFDPLK